MKLLFVITTMMLLKAEIHQYFTDARYLLLQVDDSQVNKVPERCKIW